MAETALETPAVIAPKKVSKKAPDPEREYATVEQLNSISASLKQVVDVVSELHKAITKPPTAQEAKKEEAIKQAAPDEIAPVTPSWEKRAHEIIGEALDHVECYYPENGGIIFTVVIKPEHSNAPKDYLARHKADRRSKQIGNDGIQGVDEWCMLVSANLKRGKNFNNK